MSKVKIFLEPGETIQEAEDSLLKALNHHNDGGVHSAQTFDDPAMVSVERKMEQLHSKIYQEMMQEIFETLDKDYVVDGN